MVRNIVACLNIAGALPTWVFYLLLRPWLPRWHPWRRRERFTLRDWHASQTPLWRVFDVALVGGIANIALLFALLAIS